MVSAWRIVKARHATDAFSGDGARKHGGRWNAPGVRVVYTAGSAALAMLELLAHLEPFELLEHYVLIRATFDAALVETLNTNSLPTNWREEPPPTDVQQLGDAWVNSNRSAVLRVPSVVLPTEEWNYLLNPAHPRYKISIGAQQPVRYDPRLLKVLES